MSIERPDKQRVTVTVDPDLLQAAQGAVEAGQASSMSAWVNEAMREKAVRDHKLKTLAAAVSDYEREFGEITDAEIVRQRRADRSSASVVRGTGKASAS